MYAWKFWEKRKEIWLNEKTHSYKNMFPIPQCISSNIHTTLSGIQKSNKKIIDYKILTLKKKKTYYLKNYSMVPNKSKSFLVMPFDFILFFLPPLNFTLKQIPISWPYRKIVSTISDSIDNPTILLIGSTLAALFQTHCDPKPNIPNILNTHITNIQLNTIWHNKQETWIFFRFHHILNRY